LIDTLTRLTPSTTGPNSELFVKSQKLMYDSAWFGYIWFEPGNFLVNNRIQGSRHLGSLREAEWWIKTQRDALEIHVILSEAEGSLTCAPRPGRGSFDVA